MYLKNIASCGLSAKMMVKILIDNEISSNNYFCTIL